MRKYPSIPLAQTVVRLCKRMGIKRVVICAGSRNAPLTNGFVSNAYFKTYSVVDERAAAFFALGMAQQLKCPVGIVCTSGSALLNMYPAIAEAFYSDIPIVVISADRMPHRIDIGDGQTIRQNGVFDLHLEASAKLKPDVIHATKTLLSNPMQKLLPKNVDDKTIQAVQQQHQQHNEKEIIRVLNIAFEKSGPVHLNIPLEEPLYGMTDQPLSLAKPILDTQKTPKSPKDFDTFYKHWHTAEKKWVIIGQMAPGEMDQKLIDQLCLDPSVIVFTETTSNVNHPKAIGSIDVLMAPLEQLDFDPKRISPEVILTFGGMVVSKKIKAFLRHHPPQHHAHVHFKKAYNTYYCLDFHFKLAPNAFLKLLYPKELIVKTNNFQTSVLSLYQKLKSKGADYINTLPYSDFYVFKVLSTLLPPNLHLQVANSSSIRYTQLLEWSKGTQFFCNRGTSGIDGSTATAVGASLIQKLPTVLITGDLSFFYDINGLWNDAIPKNFKVVLINNYGGGIFRILPGEKDTLNYDLYFETIHRRDAKHLAKAFGFQYKCVRYGWNLERKLSRFLSTDKGPKLIEIQTPRRINDQVLLNYFKEMADNSLIS